MKRKGNTASHITHCNRPSPPTHRRQAVSVSLKQANRGHTSPMPYADDALIHSRLLTQPPPLPSNFELRRPFRLPAKLPFSNYASRTPPRRSPSNIFANTYYPTSLSKRVSTSIVSSTSVRRACWRFRRTYKTFGKDCPQERVP